MKSMTGYGKGIAVDGNKTVSIEIKAVNNRYVEINSRYPKSFAQFDETIRRQVQSVIKRGTLEVFLLYDNNNSDNKKIDIDWNLAGEYISSAKKLCAKFGLDDSYGIERLLSSPEVVKINIEKDCLEEAIPLVAQATSMAIDNLDAMRCAEGGTIKSDLYNIIDKISGNVTLISERVPLVIDEYRQKLKQRIAEHLEGFEVDQAKLINEVAFFVDKSDVSEEISRLKSHINQFTRICGEDDQQGRKLDFITQEINREMNTIGSKSNDTTLTNIVVQSKNEIEKIKEQIRNIE